MIKKGFVTTIIFALSTLVQLVSQIVVTRIYGASLSLDIFLAAVAIPTVIVTIIYATLNDTFLPELASKKEEDREEFLLGNLLTIGSVTFIASVLTSFLSDAISLWLYAPRGAEFVYQVSFQMRYLFLSIPLSVIATMLGSYFYAKKDFVRFPIAQLVGSLVNVLIIVVLAPIVGIWALISAFVVNILIQILFVIPKALFTTTPLFSNPITLLLTWFPLIVGNFAMRSDAILIRSLGADLPSGYLVYLNLVTKIFALATSVATIGVQVLLLPHLVEYFNKQELNRAFSTVRRAKVGAILISVAVTILLVFVAPIVISLVFVGGQFTQHDAQVTSSMIPLFIIPAIGWGINSIFMQPLIALKKRYLVGTINVGSMIMGFGVGNLINSQLGPLQGIVWGLTTLIFSGIIGNELVWQYYKRKLQKSQLLS